MITKVLFLTLNALLLALGFPAAAQQPANKVPRIGYLTSATKADHAPSLEAFRKGLQELGYVEGKNISIEYRYAEGRLERLPALSEGTGPAQG